MISTLATTIMLTCVAAEAYCIQWVIDRFKRRREERREAQRAVWRQKYDKQIAKRRAVRENREQIWRMIK